MWLQVTFTKIFKSDSPPSSGYGGTRVGVAHRPTKSVEGYKRFKTKIKVGEFVTFSVVISTEIRWIPFSPANRLLCIRYWFRLKIERELIRRVFNDLDDFFFLL